MESILPPLESRMVSDFLTQSISRSDITLVRASSLKGLLASALFSWSPEMTFWLSYWKDQDSRGDQSSNCPPQSAEYAREASLDPPTTESLLCEKPLKNEPYWDSPFDIHSWAPSREPASTASHMRAPFWMISSVKPSNNCSPSQYLTATSWESPRKNYRAERSPPTGSWTFVNTHRTVNRITVLSHQVLR